MSVQKLKDYLTQHKIAFELKEYPMSVATASSGPHPLTEIVKTVIFIDGKNDLYAVMVRGDDRVSMTRMGFNLKLDGLRLAKPDEVLAKTGYPVGGVPPCGFEAKFVADEKVKAMPFCWAGGGSDKALLKVNPADIIKHTKAVVVRVTG